MEILLIGNGFDLEHNLPTSYRSFLEFCQRAKVIYTSIKTTPLNHYIHENLDGWAIDSYIKDELSCAFEGRKCKSVFYEDGTCDSQFITPNKALNELYSHIHNNAWLEYFGGRYAKLGQNWIDFEAEISQVIQALHSARSLLAEGNLKVLLSCIPKDTDDILSSILKASNNTVQTALGNTEAADKFAIHLNTELNRLIRALEIYIAHFVHGVTVTKRSSDLNKIHPTHVLSFNYSDTYERVYGNNGSEIIYDYIHGRADMSKNEKTSDLVLGIDEYLDDDRKDKELEFLPFKKFYQRIYKSTGNHYLSWIDEIKDDCVRARKSIESMEAQAGFPMYMDIDDFSCHTLYIYGHSLDITDRDVLKKLICNDNVKTKIFYHRKSEDDKSSLGKQIRNLIGIMGQDELIRRTGGTKKTIEFIPQALSE